MFPKSKLFFLTISVIKLLYFLWFCVERLSTKSALSYLLSQNGFNRMNSTDLIKIQMSSKFRHTDRGDLHCCTINYLSLRIPFKFRFHLTWTTFVFLSILGDPVCTTHEYLNPVRFLLEPREKISNLIAFRIFKQLWSVSPLTWKCF